MSFISARNSSAKLMAVSAIGALFGSIGLLSVAARIAAQVHDGSGGRGGSGAFLSFPLEQFSANGLLHGHPRHRLSLNFGLAGTIVQERSPAPLRGRVSASSASVFSG